MEGLLCYLGTEDGIRVLAVDDDGVELVGTGLDGNAVRGIAVHPDDPRRAFVGCGLRGWGLHRTDDAGASFDAVGFGDEWVWDVAFAPGDPETVYVGTEPPNCYRSDDAGESFARLPGLDDLPSRSRWTFFHEPFEAGHVHGFAGHPDRPGWLFAGVEHGALVYTEDGGETWTERLVGSDLHRVEVDPADPERVFAGAGEGLFLSEDGGERWTPVEPLAGRYVHGIEFGVDGSLYVYAADGNAPLFRSDDGGETWRTIWRGLAPAGPADPLAAHPVDAGTVLYASDAAGESGDGTLHVSHDRGESWEELPIGLPKVWRLQVALGGR